MSVPDAAPSGQDVVESVGSAIVGGLVGAVVGGGGEPEDGPVGPIIGWKAAKVTAGFFKTAIVRMIERRVVVAATAAGCMSQNGVPILQEPGGY